MKKIIATLLISILPLLATSTTQGGEKIAHVNAGSNDDAVKTSQNTKPRTKNTRNGTKVTFKK